MYITGKSFDFIRVPDLNHYYTPFPSNCYMIKVVMVSYLLVVRKELDDLLTNQHQRRFSIHSVFIGHSI
jgi:hypothetical protein